MDSSKYFSREELKCKCGCDTCEMDEAFLTKLDLLRFRYGKPIYLNSAYRCPEHNKKVGGVGDSPHTQGLGVDIRCDRQNAYQILKLVMALRFSGIGISQKGDGRFIHIDDQQSNSKGTRPNWLWSY